MTPVNSVFGFSRGYQQVKNCLTSLLNFRGLIKQIVVVYLIWSNRVLERPWQPANPSHVLFSFTPRAIRCIKETTWLDTSQEAYWSFANLYFGRNKRLLQLAQLNSGFKKKRGKKEKVFFLAERSRCVSISVWKSAAKFASLKTWSDF